MATPPLVLDPEAVVLRHARSSVSSRRTPSQDLPGCALRQRVHEAVLARALEAGERRGEAVRVELLRRRRRRRRPRRRAARAARPAAPITATSRTPGCAREHVLDLERDGRSRRPRRSCRRPGRRSTGRRPRRGGRCRRCGTSRRGSPSRRRRAGSSSRRTPRPSRACTQISPLALEPQPRVDGGPPGAARLRELVAPDRERVDLRRAVVVDEDVGREHLRAAPDERRRHRRARVAERPDGRDVVRRRRRGGATRSWKSVGAR